MKFVNFGKNEAPTNIRNIKESRVIKTGINATKNENKKTYPAQD